MQTTSLDRYLGPPPRLVAPAEALPHLAGLALAPYRGELPEEMELFPVGSLEDSFDNKTGQEMLDRALGTQKVRDRLGRGRYTTIGVSRRGERAKNERRTYLIVAYDYSADMTVEISIDEHGELLEIMDERYPPPPTHSEIERAIELARLDARLASKIDALVGMAIPFSGVNNELANRRVLEVLFGCRADRLPKFRAWVDLSRETVLFAGASGECCGQKAEVKQ